MCDSGSFDGPVPAEGKARLAVNVLRVSCIRTIITLVYGHLDLRSFRMGLPDNITSNLISIISIKSNPTLLHQFLLLFRLDC